MIDVVIENAAKLIRDDEFFRNVAVVCMTNGDVAEQLRLGCEKHGMAIAIEAVGGDMDWTAHVGQRNGFDVRIQIFENVMMNRGARGTGKNAFGALIRLYEIFSPARHASPLLSKKWSLVNSDGGYLVLELTCSAAIVWGPTL